MLLVERDRAFLVWRFRHDLADKKTTRSRRHARAAPRRSTSRHGLGSAATGMRHHHTSIRHIRPASTNASWDHRKPSRPSGDPTATHGGDTVAASADSRGPPHRKIPWPPSAGVHQPPWTSSAWPARPGAGRMSTCQEPDPWLGQGPAGGMPVEGAQETAPTARYIGVASDARAANWPQLGLSQRH